MPWTRWREIKRSQQFNFQKSDSSLSWPESRARPRWHELNSLNRLILPYFENRFQAKRLIRLKNNTDCNPFPSSVPRPQSTDRQPFLSVGSPQVFSKSLWRMCEEAGRGRRNRCDEKSSPDVAAASASEDVGLLATFLRI